MSIGKLLQRFGRWTTIQKWNEPWWYRVQLRGDAIARLALAFAVGWVPTAILLVLFAININPPNPLFALIGMLLFGGLALMFLVRGEKTASGEIRVCEEGIARKRFYVGLSAQWIERASWPYEQIRQVSIVPGQKIARSYSLLIIHCGAEVDLIGVPAHLDLKQIAQVMMNKGVAVHASGSVPTEFTKSLNLPVALATSTIAMVLAFVAAGFYATKTWHGADREIAEVEDFPELEDNLPPASLVEPLDTLASSNIPNALPASRTSASPPSATPSFPTEMRPAIPGFPNARSQANPFDGNNPAFPAKTPPAVGIPEAVAPASSTLPSASARTQKTSVVGGNGGFPFEFVNRDGQPMIGMLYAVGSWSGKPAFLRLEPVHDPSAQSGGADTVVAREGYAIAGFEIDAESLVHAVRIAFARRTPDDKLDLADSYLSDWIGQRVSNNTQSLMVENGFAIGVHGRRGAVIDAIGLVVLDPS